MREKVWYELVHTKMGDHYLSLYLNRQKTVRKYYTIFILVFSVSGIFSWAFWSSIPAVIACGCMGVMQLIKLTENQIIPSENDISNVSELRSMFISYFNDLEKLWADNEAGRITDEKMTQEFYRLRKVGAKIEETDNKLNIRDIRKLRVRSDIQTRNYLSQYHN